MSENIYKPIPNPLDYVERVSLPRLQLGLKPLLLVILWAGVIGVFLLSLSMGSVDIPTKTVVRILLGNGDTQLVVGPMNLSTKVVADDVFGQYEEIRRSRIIIVNSVRFPKAATAALSGAALAASGLMMQTFFRNPLAGPFVLGISSGASLGVALVVLSTGTIGVTLLAGVGRIGDLQLASAAAIGAGGTMAIILLISTRVQNSMTLLIVGLMIGYLVSALVSLLLYFSISEQIQAYIRWTFGSFSSVTGDQLYVLAGAVSTGLLIALAMTKSLNALLLGENYSRSLGMNIAITRAAILVSTAILAGVVTAFCGPIGFIGIAVPHLCRSIFNTSDHRALMQGTILLGAIVAMIAAIIAEFPGDNVVLPLNAVTAFIGAPVVMFVILRRRNLRQSFGS